MITNVSLMTLYVTDQDAARDFYVDKLGFEARSDVKMGDGLRWVTIGHPEQPELEITLMLPGPPLDPEMAQTVERSLAKGTMGGFGLRTDNCQKTYEELSAQGVAVPTATLQEAIRRGGGHARQLGELAGPCRAQRVLRGGLPGLTPG